MVVEHYFEYVFSTYQSIFHLFIYLFIYLFLPWVFAATAGFLLLPRAGSTLWVRCVGVSLQ